MDVDDHENVGAHSSRGRAYHATEKGKQYQLDLKLKNYRHLLNALQRKGSILCTHTLQEDALEVVKVKFEEWKEIFKEFTQMNKEVSDLLPESDLKDHKTKHSAHMQSLNEIEMTVEKYVDLLRESDEASNVEPFESVSNCDIVSRVSQGSSSVETKVGMLRLDEVQRQAELTAKAEALNERHQLEKQRLELQMEENQLALDSCSDASEVKEDIGHAEKYSSLSQKEMKAELQKRRQQLDIKKLELKFEEEHYGLKTAMAISKAKTRALDQFEKQTANRNVEKQKEKEEKDCSQSFIHQTSARPCAQGGSENEVLEGLTVLISDQMKRAHLPTLEPEIFRGDVGRFSLWMKSFETYIERQTSSPVERLHFLNKYTGGEARDAIVGFLHLRTDDAYNKAKEKLLERYGNEFIMSSSYRQRIRDWPVIRPGDGKALRNFSDFLEQCLIASSAVCHLKVLDDPHENAMMLKKLPKHLVDRWKRVVDEWLYECQGGPDSPKRYPPFPAFVKFLSKEARIACSPVNIQEAEVTTVKDVSNRGRTFTGKARTFTSTAGVKAEGPRSSKQSNTQHSMQASRHGCFLCPGSHFIDKCEAYLRMTLSERQAVVRKHGLCRGCLKRGHIWRMCQRKQECGKCGRLHPTSLHDDAFSHSAFLRSPEPVLGPDIPSKDSSLPQATSLHVTSDDNANPTSSCSHSMIVPVELHVRNRPERKMLVYAVLDPQSDACFISESVRKTLKADGKSVLLELRTITGRSAVKSAVIDGLVVQAVSSEEEIQLPACYVRDEIPADRCSIPRKHAAQQWTHLAVLADHLPPYFPSAEIGLLIGTNCARAIKPREVIPGHEDDPWAVKTALGWGIVGPVGGSEAGTGPCRFVDTGQGQRKLCHFAFKTQVHVTPMQISCLLEADFTDTAPVKTLSVEDQTFLMKMKKGIHRRPDGHYEMPLPMKDCRATLPNNRTMALKRLQGLKSKLVRNGVYRCHYLSAMKATLDKGYAEPVPPGESEKARVWYIPHHGVYHPQKPDKLRVVFDCSAEYRGHVLNSNLLQGPDMTNSLTGILCRFRKNPVTFTCDIEGMFNQVGVNIEDRNYLRFLWWKDGCLEQEPSEYRMTTHLFGATSSPACAMFALRTAADDHEDIFGKEAADFVRNDFYIDDGLTSVSDPEKAIRLIDNVRKMCEHGGFKLQKFVSNSRDVVKSIPLDLRCAGLQNLDVGRSDLPVQRTLGVEWDTEADVFQFSVTRKDRKVSRRGILSTVSSVFDPLGFISPFILTGKCILKELCQQGYGWDEDVPETVADRWNEWFSDLPLLAKIKIPRCFIPEGFGSIMSAELHHFSDASLVGYGQCSYLRLIDDGGQAVSRLVMSKARVTPSKSVTIPRLELTAALLSVQVSCFLRRELKIENLEEYFWTDSRVVLGYISNEARRFHIFVANRVQQIRDQTIPSQWRYIDTNSNPADAASRGLTATQLVSNDLWWKGPPVLSDAAPIPEQELQTSIDPGDPEIKRSGEMKTRSVFTTAATQKGKFASLLERLQYFSDWHRAKRAVAICRRYVEILRRHVSSDKAFPRDSDPISVEEIRKAEVVILTAVQREVFAEEFKTLRTETAAEACRKRMNRRQTRALAKGSPLYRLDPCLRKDGILCVGGRLSRASLSVDLLHPVILPRKSHITGLIIDQSHRKTHHSGRGMTLSELRTSGYWVIAGRSAVGSHILKCVLCKKIRGHPVVQKMSDLPSDRLEEVPPFTYSAVDYFGPFLVKERRSLVKRWGVLFTCMSSRAVHIETANTLTTDAFLNAYRRFVARRGPVRQLRSDQGTNFIGGKRALEAALEEMGDGRIRQELLKENCDLVEFRMNPPSGSHMGGVWERMIRTAKSVLAALLAAHHEQLDDELLRTFLAEVEAVINGRPLTTCGMNPVDKLEPLTPNQLLTQKSRVVLPPPGKFQSPDLYSRRRWRRVQHLADIFWSRWRAEFLPTLQQRRKWTRRLPDLRDGDVVLVMDPDVPRGSWKMGRVVSTAPSADGLIRTVTVQVGESRLVRPVHKLIVLLEAHNAPHGEPRGRVVAD